MYGAPTWARWRFDDDTRAAAPARPADRRALRPGGGRALAGFRCHARAERRSRRADHARRLRRLLAGRAARRRSLRLAGAGDPGRAAARRDPLLGALRLRRARARRDAREEFSPDRLWPGPGTAGAGRAALDGRRAVDPDLVRRRRALGG